VAISVYFDGCRIKRNVSEYEVAGGVTDTDADGLLEAVKNFAIDVEAWIKAHHPSLAGRIAAEVLALLMVRKFDPDE
jgi:hypothetical protein